MELLCLKKCLMANDLFFFFKVAKNSILKNGANDFLITLSKFSV